MKYILIYEDRTIQITNTITDSIMELWDLGIIDIVDSSCNRIMVGHTRWINLNKYKPEIK